jgi:hypothetical protein
MLVRRSFIDTWKPIPLAARTAFYREGSVLPRGDLEGLSLLLCARSSRGPTKRQIRMSSFIDQLIERALAEAQARGELDNLPGMGRPIEPSTLSTDLFAKTLTESGAMHPIAALARQIRELQSRLVDTAEPDARRAIQKEIADLQTRQALEMEQLRRFS